MTDPERYYRLRFYFFLGCGAVVSIFYILTLGFAFDLAGRRMRAQVEIDNRWHKAEYDRAWTYRNRILEHVVGHDDEMRRAEAERKQILMVLGRLEGFLKQHGD